MTDLSFAKTASPRAVSSAASRKARAVPDWGGALRNLVPTTELLPVLAAAVVMVVCLGQLF